MSKSDLDTEVIYKEISKLTSQEKVCLINKLILEISTEIKNSDQLDIYDIKGLGKEIWEGIDAQEYVNKERDSWNS